MREKNSRAKVPDVLECPECGSVAMRRVRNRCRLRDGTVIGKLKRFRCAKCGANFFDDEAMAAIEAARQAGVKAK